MFQKKPNLARLTIALTLGVFLFVSCAFFGESDQPRVNIECFNESREAGTTVSDQTEDGSWLQFRHDRKLTGNTSLVGEITCPEVLWSFDLGARKTWTAVKFEPATQSILDVPNDGEIGNRWNQKQFKIAGALIDLDGNGKNLVSPSDYGRHKVGDYLTDLPGLERISCDTEQFQSGRGGDSSLPCYLQNRVDGKWETIWTSKPFDGFSNNMSTTGQVLVGDFDSDGQLETAVLSWYDMHLLDLETGEIEQTGNFQKYGYSVDSTTGRAYGWFGAFNLDNDSKSEFVILGDFEMFISVIGWQNGMLVELWDYQIEAGTTLNKAAHHPGVNPVADIDGDGFPEIVTSIFNENGDNRWHVVGFDGLTGEIKIDLADAYLTGIGDIENDGVSELFVSTTKGRVVPEYGDIAIYSLVGDSLNEIWSANNSGFETYDIPRFPDNVNSRSTHYKRTLFFQDDWTTGPPVFMTREYLPGTDDVKLRVLQAIDADVTEIASIIAPAARVIAYSTGTTVTEILIESNSHDPEKIQLRFSNASGRIAHSGRTERGDGDISTYGSLLTGTIVDSRRQSDRPLIITQGHGEEIIALELSPDGKSVLQKWRGSGRGMISGSDTISTNAFASPLLADVTGSGMLAVIVADQAADGRAVIKALDNNGQTLWETPFNVPASPPIWNEAGITNWMAGNFTSNQYEDILVSVRTGKSHTDRLFLLNGRTGEIVWNREFGGYYSGCRDSSGAGGIHMPVFDWDASGTDDVLNTYSSLFAVYGGQEGSLLMNRWTTGWCPSEKQLFSEGFLKHPIPVVADFLGNGQNQILFAGNDATLALLELDGDVIWQTPYFSGTPERTIQGVGDINGDSKLDLVSVGHCSGEGDEIQVYDAQTGDVRWSMALNKLCGSSQQASSVTMADIDGDGRDEALFSYENIIYAIAENDKGEGELLWTATFGSDSWQGELGDIVIADVDGTGKAQILVNTASGYLFALGSTK